MAIINLDAALGKFADKLNLKLELVLRKITIDVHGGLTKRTPVDTGRARASWNIAQGAPNTTVPPAPAAPVRAKGTPRFTSPPAVGTQSPTTFVVSGTDPLFVTSSLVYMEALENGHSAQAPAGMIVVTVREEEAKIEAYLKSLPP